jgi:hypothetical protein
LPPDGAARRKRQYLLDGFARHGIGFEGADGFARGDGITDVHLDLLALNPECLNRLARQSAQD